MIPYDVVLSCSKKHAKTAISASPPASSANRCARAAATAAESRAFFANMTLTLDDVRRIAHLARIDIDAIEATAVHAQLEAIFALINELRAVDTSQVEPMAHAQDVTLPLREDKVTEGDQHRLFQSAAPAVEDDLYLVPKVIE